jgi:ABC-type phosphate transport system ATPase subunit
MLDVQLALDAVIVSAFILFTGGITSLFASLYVLPIIAASTVRFRRGAIVVAGISAVLYLCVAGAQYVAGELPLRPQASYIVALNVFGFFAVALLSGSLAEGVRSAGASLARASSQIADLQALNQHVIDSLRCQISIVLQEALLFSGSVRDNIAYGKTDATQPEIEAAARAAQAHAFIAELPKGYDTLVGERGVGLSGGQRQRLAIARALLVDPCLLILDDSTSAVDTETEAAIREALERLIRARRRTVFVIAQRISTVRDADLILVLDDGGVAAQGRHEDLLRDSELYNQILGSQLLNDAVATNATSEARP